ncbi:MAG: LapA family protein [Sphingomonadaceae bacterium]
MQFLRTLFWVVIAVVAVIFATRNWNTVTINLWGGLQADVRLPLLIFGAFFVGLLPPWVLHRTTRWSLRRRLDSTERALAEARGYEAPAAPAIPAQTAPNIIETVPAPSSVPVPPAVS